MGGLCVGSSEADWRGSNGDVAEPADWADGEELEVVTGAPDYGAKAPVVGESRSEFSPDYAQTERPLY